MITVMGTIGTDPTVVDVTAQALAQLKRSTREFQTKIEVWQYDALNSSNSVPMYNLIKTMVDDDIISFSVDQSLGNDDMLGIGGTYVGSLEMSLLKTANVPTSFSDCQIKPFVKIIDTINTTPETLINYDYIQLGVYYIDNSTVSKTDYSVNMTCYDALYILDSYVVPDGAIVPGQTMLYTATLLEESYAGAFAPVELSFDLDDAKLATATWKVAEPEDMSIRELLSTMAELLGANVVSNNHGVIDFRGITYGSVELTADNYVDFQVMSNSAPMIDKLTCKKDDDADSISVGSVNGTGMAFENNQVRTVAELQNIYSRCYSIVYTAFSSKLQGFPIFQVGDRVYITDKSAIKRSCIIAHHKLSYAGGLISEINVNAPKTEETIISQNNSSTSGTTLAYQVSVLKRDVSRLTTLLTGELTAGAITNLVSFTLQKAGKLVQLQGITTESGTLVTGSTMFTLPEGYRPTDTIRTMLYGGNGLLGRVDVNTDGTVVFYGVDASKTLANMNVMFYAA